MWLALLGALKEWLAKEDVVNTSASNDSGNLDKPRAGTLTIDNSVVVDLKAPNIVQQKEEAHEILKGRR